MSPAGETDFRGFAESRRPGLRRTAFLLCGDWHQADDLVKAALVKLYVAWPRLHDIKGPDAYARRTLVRCYLDERRRPWRREAPVETVDDWPVDDIGVEQALDLRAALSRLPARQRATLLLRYWADASVAETAETLRCSEGTVKSQTARALTTLRSSLKDPAFAAEEQTQ
jgi:RNA polymerase sigma-70 factor (sigma-E family)